jgi:hypothetical protein
MHADVRRTGVNRPVKPSRSPQAGGDHEARPAPDYPPEVPIAALIPAALQRPRPEPAPVGDLPPAPAPYADPAVFTLARPNPSGQISVRTLLSALDWGPGDRVTVTVEHGCIVVAAATQGGRSIGADGSLVLPVAARRMCAIADRSQVLVAALPDAGLLVVHPIAAIARHLSRKHSQIIRRHHDRRT